MKVKRKQLSICIFILILLFPLYGNFSVKHAVKADPVPINSQFWRHIGVLPLDTEVNISIAQANVELDIDALVFKTFKIMTVAEYIFYNYNQTSTLTVVLPFDSYNNFEGANQGTIDLRVDDVPVDYIVVDLSQSQSEYLDSLIGSPMPEIIRVVATNITFSGYTNTTLSYSAYNSFKRQTSGTYVEIIYIVSTGLVWYGNLTEKVEFKVHGIQPDDYQELDHHLYPVECKVSNISDGKSYIWEWIDGGYFINPSITFTSRDTRYFENYGQYILIGSSILLISLSSSVIYLLKRKRKN